MSDKTIVLISKTKKNSTVWTLSEEKKDKEETVKYREEILLWGKNYTPIKFVLTISSKGTAIFVCTDTNISALKIIS